MFYDTGTNTSTTASTTVWQIWIDGSTSASTTASTTICCANDAAWYRWTTAGNTSDCTPVIGAGVWYNWAAQPTPYGTPPIPIPAVPPETAEQRRAREEAAVRQHAEYQRKAKEMEERRAKARLLANELLLSHLDELQRDALEKEGAFLVLAQSGKIYRIRRGYAGNIDEISDEGKIVRSLCVHLDESSLVPEGDHMLAQKLFLEADEETLINRANKKTPYSNKVVDITHILEQRRRRAA